MLKNSSLPTRRPLIHKNTYKVAIPLLCIGIVAGIILFFFHNQIFRFAQKRIDKTLHEYALVPEEEKQQKRETIQDKKNSLVTFSLEELKPEERITFNRFLRDNDIPEDKRTLATLLYFYPYGFTQPGESKVQYYASLHDFSVVVPKTWKIFPVQPNFVAFLAPETQLDDDGRLSEPNEAFDVYIYKDCDGLNKDTLIADVTKKQRTSPVIKLSGPEDVALTSVLNATKYRYRVPKDSYAEPVFWRQDIYIEDYFFTLEKGTYLITYIYVPSMARKYRATAEDIIASFITEGRSCEEDTTGLTDDQIEMFYLGVGSRYQQSKAISK